MLDRFHRSSVDRTSTNHFDLHSTWMRIIYQHCDKRSPMTRHMTGRASAAHHEKQSSYQTWRALELSAKSDSSSRNSAAKTFGLSMNSREKGFLETRWITLTESKNHWCSIILTYRHNAHVWLTFATPLTHRKQNECPQGSFTGLTKLCRQTLHSSERGVDVDILFFFFFFLNFLPDDSSDWLIVLTERKKHCRSVHSDCSSTEQSEITPTLLTSIGAHLDIARSVMT